MKVSKSFYLISILAVTSTTSSCSPSGNGSDVKDRIAGKYASQTESTFDYYRDTLEIRPTDDGKFDVQIIAHWSNAKEDDPNRPSNKVAGVWNKGNVGSTLVADFQASDTTLRIVEQLTGGVEILSFNDDKGTIQWPSDDGEVEIYTKVNE